MRATMMYGAHDVRVENVPDAGLVEPTDALVRVTRACICVSDLWPYDSMTPSDTGNRMGHEFIGVVDAVGSSVRTMKGRPGGRLRLGMGTALTDVPNTATKLTIGRTTRLVGVVCSPSDLNCIRPLSERVEQRPVPIVHTADLD